MNKQRLIVMSILVAACGSAPIGDDLGLPADIDDPNTAQTEVDAQPPASAAGLAATEIDEVDVPQTVPPAQPEATIDSNTSSTKPAVTVTTAAVTEERDGGIVTGQVPEALMQQVLGAATSHTGLSAAELTVTTAEAVTWSDGSLGCPEPGMSYTQALVDGYWVKLSSGDITLDYRLTTQGGMKLCTTGGSDPLPRSDT